MQGSVYIEPVYLCVNTNGPFMCRDLYAVRTICLLRIRKNLSV